MLKSPDPDFCPFANYLLGSFLNIFKSISDLKVICAQSWGHIEALRGPRSLKTSSQQHFSWVHYASDTLYYRISFLYSNKLKKEILNFPKHPNLNIHGVNWILVKFQQNLSHFFKFLSTSEKPIVQAIFWSKASSTPHLDLTYSSHNGSVHTRQSPCMPTI